MRTERDSFNGILLVAVSGSTKQLLIGFLIESNDKRLSFEQRRCSQIAAWSDDQLGERFVVWFVFLHIDMHDLLAFGSIDVVRRAGQC